MFNIFIFWVSILPFIVWNGAFEGPKIFWFFGGGVILILYWVYRILIQKKYFEFSKIDFFYFLWLGILLLASLFGVHPFESIIGGSYRHQGVLFFFLLWLVGKTVSILSSRDRKLLYKGIGLAVILEALIVFYQLIFGQVYLGKSLGTIGETNAVAGLIAIGSYFVFVSFPKIISLIPLAAIILTESRSGILAFIPNLSLAVSVFSKKVRNFLIVFIILSSAFFLLYFSIGKDNSFFENRQTIRPLSVAQIIKRPLLGYGAESGEVVFNKAFYQSGFPLSGIIVDRAHNIFLDVAMWSGILGLAAFLEWLYLIFKNLKGWGKKMAFFSFLVYSFFQPLSVVHWILLAIIVNI